MALQATQGVYMPNLLAISNAAQLSTGTGVQIDASGEKFAWIGRVWNKDRASKNITKVGFRLGTCSGIASNTLTVSLQNVDTTTGPPYQPDGTQDQTATIAAGSLTSNAWVLSPALSASRSVSYGELIAVVAEYTSFSGTPVVQFSQIIGSSNSFPSVQSGPMLFTASWAAVTQYSNILLEFDDGSFGTLSDAYPCATINTHTFNSGSSPNEHALAFTVPFKCKVDGIYAWMNSTAATADFDLVLYDSTPTALASCSFDSNALRSTIGGYHIGEITEQTLNAGTQYYITVKPTTANNCAVYSFDVNAANHFQAWPGGTSWQYSTRSGGSFAAHTTTRRLMAGIRISALSDDASSGGSVGVIGS